MVARSRRILLVAALLALPAACADEEVAGPETTLEEAQDACLAYAEASCRVFASCRGEDEAAIDGCLTLASDRCARHVEDNTCWEGLRAGYEDCLSVEDAACEDLCDEDGVCIYSCFFEECVSGS
jgi:hypothetical protein